MSRKTAAVNTHKITIIHRALFKDYTGIRKTLTAPYTPTCSTQARVLCRRISACTATHSKSTEHMHAQIEVEYQMSMCNYMVNVVMIRCLNISTVVCCAGTLAIHSRGQACRQRHEMHESDCVRPTREQAVRPKIFMTSSLLMATRRQAENPRKIHHKSGGEIDGWRKRECLCFQLWRPNAFKIFLLLGATAQINQAKVLFLFVVRTML